LKQTTENDIMNENQQENPMYHNTNHNHNRCDSSKENTMNRQHNRNLSRDQTMTQPSSGRKRHLTARRPLFCLAMLVCLAGSGTAVAFDQPKVYDLKPKDHVVIIGDSVTADGQCIGGFVRLIDQAQHEQVPELGVIVRANGAYGAGMQHFPQHCGVERLAKSSNPPTVAIMALGLNDAGEGEKGLPTYTDRMRKAVTLLRELKMTVILCTLTGARANWRLYSDAVRTVATEMKCPLIDLSAVYVDNKNKNTPNKDKPDDYLPGTNPHRDGCHLNMYGETLSASTYLKAFGLKPVWQKYQIRACVFRKSYRTWPTSDSTAGIIKIEPEFTIQSPTPKDPGGWTGSWPIEQQGYAPGTKITLTVLPAAGLTFNRWYTLEEGTLKETTPSLTVTIDRHTWIYAEVKPIEAKKP
jgi:lysophospholipase L1-like esterase